MLSRVILILGMTLGFMLAPMAEQAPRAADGQEEDDWGDDEWGAEEEASPQWHGFLESAIGSRLSGDPALAGRDLTLADLRLRLESKYTFGQASLSFKGEGWYDHVSEKLRGDIRDLSLSMPLSNSIDLKVGRQILTWGTGDFLFINDQFGKSWKAFFSGQNDEFLKIASNSAKLSYYTGSVSIDFVWTPTFQADDYIQGGVFSFFSPQLGRNVAPDFTAELPDKGFGNGELAGRVKFQKGSAEYALYAYKGYTGTPIAVTAMGMPTFAQSQTLGASMIRPVGKGLFNAELGFQENSGDQNSYFLKKQFKALVGYEREVVKDLTMSGQVYLEYIQDHAVLKQSMISSGIDEGYVPDQLRQVLTMRSTYLTNGSNTIWSLFAFYSPTDRDGYIRPRLTHRVNDSFSVDLGVNLFFGKKAHSFFGQFEKASNGYVRMRYGF